MQVAISSDAFRASAARQNGSPPAEKLRFQRVPTDLQNTAKDLGVGL